MLINANIKAGKNTFSKIADILKKEGYENPAVLVDKNLFDNSEYVSKIIQTIVKESMLLFYDYPFEPSYQMLDKMMTDIRMKKIDKLADVWIGIGGGSTMDTAKGLAILSNNHGSSINYKGFPTGINKPLPVIAIPSTTGTGSEVVFNASFIDEETKVKMGINYANNYPVLAILDPLIPSTAPMSVLASSGSDALVHALEAFMSPESNEQVRFFSKKAYSLIMSNMLPILKGKGDLINWQNMQWAAIYSMFALSNSTSGPTGALSYYLGTHFKVSHGVAGGYFIGNICKYNHENGYYELSELYEGLNKNKLNNDEKSLLVIQEIEYLLKLANMPQSLASFNVKESDLVGFNQFAAKVKVAMDYNPIKIAPSRVADLFITI